MAAIAPQFEEAPRRDFIAAGLSAVSWPAVFAGATAAAALSLVLMVLGTGLGLSVVSPWASQGASAEAISWSTIAWIGFQALAASGLGGYIAGRLRVKWPAAVHSDEVYFRDTAHGFLAWAVATLITAAALTSVIGAIVGAGTKAATEVAAGGAQGVGQGIAATMQGAALQGAGGQGAAMPSSQQGSQSMYLVDSLFRVEPGTTTPANAPADGTAGTGAMGDSRREEVARILDNGMRGGSLSAGDTRYIGALVAQRTGLSQPDAEARVTSVFQDAREQSRQAEARARQVADQARRAGAYTALWIFASLLLGAFFASLMATFGGRRRDLF